MRRTLLAIFGGLVFVVSGLALSVQYDLEWLRIGSIIVAIVGPAIAVMVTKRRRQRKTRSDARDSIEAVQDVQSRAAAFVDAAVLTALAGMISVITPGLPAWTVCFSLLVALAGAYWIRRAMAASNANR